MSYDLRRELLGKVVERLGALADENRLRMLLLLRPGERNVTGLTAETGLSQASVSKHLAHLRRVGFVEARRDGSAVFYRVGDDSVFEVLRIVWDVHTPPKHVRDLEVSPALVEPLLDPAE